MFWFRSSSSCVGRADRAEQLHGALCQRESRSLFHKTWLCRRMQDHDHKAINVLNSYVFELQNDPVNNLVLDLGPDLQIIRQGRANLSLRTTRSITYTTTWFRQGDLSFSWVDIVGEHMENTLSPFFPDS